MMSPKLTLLCSFLPLLLLSLSSITICRSVAVCDPSDRRALLQIKTHFNDASPFATWNSTSDCCTWDNVICGDETGPHPGRVTDLTLVYRDDVVGQIPPVVGDLPFLRYLIFAHLPNLTGPVPSTITKLDHLISLQLDWNHLSGPIPGFLNRLKSLQYLDLSFNAFSGTIPRSLAQANLTTFTLAGNQLTGDASFLFGRNKPLVGVFLNHNRLKFDLTNVDIPRTLTMLNIAHNEIYGSLPERLGQIGLSNLDVSYNQLCGPIPAGLERFNPKRFDHNKCLCGAPLPPCKK